MHLSRPICDETAHSNVYPGTQWKCEHLHWDRNLVEALVTAYCACSQLPEQAQATGQATDVHLLQGGSVVQCHMVAVHMRMLRRSSCQQSLLAGGCEEQR